jgi:hypothetical protein
VENQGPAFPNDTQGKSEDTIKIPARHEALSTDAEIYFFLKKERALLTTTGVIWSKYLGARA